ncbi:Hypothetical predicted protein [Octopus vulgaris]|uniref:Reverse transcriptase domain-containing protein n=1 Tax=Octopus vulgaris TaxID=6645 RepID=A0AA36AJX5_OCTVU|nr:Hypothetical predicted protein [Octopus vulgaris]
MTRVWDTETLSQDWSDAALVPFFKKGDKRCCSNYRGISLIDVSAKIFASILLRRFQSERDSRTRPNQCGFRRNRGCTDKIFTLTRILEHRWCFQQKTVICFVDFAAAFDSVDRDTLWKVMQADGIPPKLLNIIKTYYRSARPRVRVYGEVSEPFEIRSGVRQGCVLSPTLFNYAIDWITTNALREFPGITVGHNFSVKDLDYADDIAILGETFADVQFAINELQRVVSQIGMKVNASKTKILTAESSPPDKTPIVLNGDILDQKLESFISNVAVALL